MGYDTQCNNNDTEMVNFLVKKVGWCAVYGTGEGEKYPRLLLALKGLFKKK